MKKMILLKNVLQQMRQVDQKGNPVPFDIEVRTWNKQNKMGGKLNQYSGAILCFKAEQTVKDWSKSLQTVSASKERKNPNHYKHYTRNIEVSKGRVVKINILLITKLNGVDMVY